MFGILQTEPIDFVLTQLRIFTLFFIFTNPSLRMHLFVAILWDFQRACRNDFIWRNHRGFISRVRVEQIIVWEKKCTSEWTYSRIILPILLTSQSYVNMVQANEHSQVGRN